MAKSQRGSDKFDVRIPDDLKDEMLSACKALNMTPSALIRKALRLYLDRFKEENVDPFGIIKEEEG